MLQEMVMKYLFNDENKQKIVDELNESSNKFFERKRITKAGYERFSCKNGGKLLERL